MKHWLLLLGCIVACVPVQGQYYYVARSINQNPGGLNTSTEAPFGLGLDPAWNVIFSGGNPAPVWTPPQLVPFPFQFNGVSVPIYKVSSSGVLTFDMASVDVPPFANSALPSPVIPNRSVCVWGLKADFPDDKIVTRTFGAAPNRQHWIMFAAYNYQGGNPACNLYWSIVLEEGTNAIYIVDQRNFITCLPSLTLGLQFDASHALMVDGSPNIGSKAGNGSGPEDNHYYEFVPGVQPEYDFSAIRMLTPRFVQLGKTPISIRGKFDHIGSKKPKTVELYYQIDNQPPKLQLVSDMNQLPDLTHAAPWKPTATGLYSVKMWVARPDGVQESRTFNDTISTTIEVVNKLPRQMALLEHATQHNCGPCAALNPALEALLDNNEQRQNTAMIKYHTWWPGANNDPMYQFNTADNASRVNYYSISGVPTLVTHGNIFKGSPGGVTVNQLNLARSNRGLFSLQITETLVGDSIEVSVTATPEASLASQSIFLRVALVQDMLSYPNPTGTNGEKDFPDVLRYFIPNGGGTRMETTVGVPTTVTGKRRVPPIFRNSVLRVVVFVQDDQDKTIYMATKSHGHYLCGNGTALTGALEVQDAGCSQDNGAITVVPSGGTGPYSFAWQNAAGTGPSVSGLTPGKYTVTVTDSAGCQMPFYAEVHRLEPPVALIDTKPISCSGAADGRMEVLIGGANGPASVSWSNGLDTEVISNLAAGTYLATVTDSAGCTTVATATLSEPAPLAAQSAATPDNGTLNGTATLTATGGTAPYTYQWSTSPAQTTSTAVGLSAGIYTVSVRDFYGCLVELDDVEVLSNVSAELLAGLQKFTLTPNPTAAMAWLDLSLDQPSEVAIQVLDLQGRTVTVKRLPAGYDHQTLLDLSDYPAGIYVVRVATTRGKTHRMLVRE